MVQGLESMGFRLSMSRGFQSDSRNAPVQPTVEARKLEHYSPHALKVKYKGSQQQSS